MMSLRISYIVSLSAMLWQEFELVFSIYIVVSKIFQNLIPSIISVLDYKLQYNYFVFSSIIIVIISLYHTSAHSLLSKYYHLSLSSHPIFYIIVIIIIIIIIIVIIIIIM